MNVMRAILVKEFGINSHWNYNELYYYIRLIYFS